MPANPITLASLRIDKPCSQNWQSMQGDDRRRFCAQCQHHVHNLSVLTEREIQKLIATTEGRLCGMLVRDSFGRVVTQPERGWNSWLHRKWSTWRLALSSALASALTATSHAQKADARSTTPQSSPPQTAATTTTNKSDGDVSPKNTAPGKKLEDEEITLVGFVINTGVTPHQKSLSGKTPEAKSDASEETITLAPLGIVACNPPKPPIRKKYKK